MYWLCDDVLALLEGTVKTCCNADHQRLRQNADVTGEEAERLRNEIQDSDCSVRSWISLLRLSASSPVRSAFCRGLWWSVWSFCCFADNKRDHVISKVHRGTKSIDDAM